MNSSITLCVVLLVLLAVNESLCCNGVDISRPRIRLCGTHEQVITLADNFTVSLTKDCHIVPIGCVTTQGFNSGQAKISVKRGGMHLVEQKLNMCTLLKEHSPYSCPVSATEVCFNGELRISIEQYRSFLNPSFAAGRYEVDYISQHDTGKFCYTAKFRIFRRS